MEDKVPLLERPGEGNDDGDDDFDPVDETVESHQNFGLDSETSKTPKTTDSLLKIKELERRKNKSIKIIIKRFPNYDPKKSPFTSTINELGRVTVFLIRSNAVEYPLLINDEINPKLPQEIVKALGPQEEIEMSTPKTSTGRETLRPKKFKEVESQWDKSKTPKIKKVFYKATEIIEENFPNFDSKRLDRIVCGINENGEVTVKLAFRENADTHTLFNKYGNINEKIPNEIKDILGEQISTKGLRDKLEIANNKKDSYNKTMKKMEESIKTKDDELKKQDDVIKEKEKEMTRLNELEELIKTKDEIIKSKEAAIKVKDVTVIKQMSAKDIEEARKEIEKITIEFNLERDKKINAEKKLEMEKKRLVELQKKISSLERERVKMEHDNKEIRESGAGFNQNLVREKEELIEKLKESEKLTNDMADMTQEKIMKVHEEINEAKRSEAEAIETLEILSNKIAELENRNEVEVAGARREINKLTSERNNAQRNLEVMEKESGDRNADYMRLIQNLEQRINDLEQEKATINERFRLYREQMEQEKANNLERIRVLSEQLERRDIGENVRINIEQQREVLEERNNEIGAELEREEEEVEERISEIDEELDGNPERMTLREKIKSIFKAN